MRGIARVPSEIHSRGHRDIFVSRLSATGREAPAVVDFIPSRDCPVSAALTDADKANLLRIKQEAIEKTIEEAAHRSGFQ